MLMSVLFPSEGEFMTRPTFLRAHQFAGLNPGPRLLILGAVHGNETCGTVAINRLIDELESGAKTIDRGLLTLVPVTNPLAWQRQQRQGDRNLNRNLRKSDTPADFEDRVANVLCDWLESHDVLLDLHSFHTAGEPFMLIGPENNTGSLEPFGFAGEEAQLVAHLGPRRVVCGWMETYARGVERRQDNFHKDPGLTDTRYGIGTTEYIRAKGGYGVTLECGQHDDPAAPDVAYKAICQVLALLQLSPLPLLPARNDLQRLRLTDVVDRYHEGDYFVKQWASFDAVKSGEVLAFRHDGVPVLAESDGCIVFPNPGAQVGGEWFYFARRE